MFAGICHVIEMFKDLSIWTAFLKHLSRKKITKPLQQVSDLNICYVVMTFWYIWGLTGHLVFVLLFVRWCKTFSPYYSTNLDPCNGVWDTSVICTAQNENNIVSDSVVNSES